MRIFSICDIKKLDATVSVNISSKYIVLRKPLYCVSASATGRDTLESRRHFVIGVLMLHLSLSKVSK